MSRDFSKYARKKKSEPKKTKEKPKREEKSKEVKKEEVEKEPCPYCGEKYKSVSRHLPYCDENPENKEKKEREEKAGENIKELLGKIEKQEEKIEVLQDAVEELDKEGEKFFEYKTTMRTILDQHADVLIEDFSVLKRHFRGHPTFGNRPNLKAQIESFENRLEKLKELP